MGSMRTRKGKDDGAGTADGLAGERMSERNDGTVEREWVVVVVKEQDGEKQGEIGKIEEFLLAGDLRPLN